jgi:hypothetical protein
MILPLDANVTGTSYRWRKILPNVQNYQPARLFAQARGNDGVASGAARFAVRVHAIVTVLAFIS